MTYCIGELPAKLLSLEVFYHDVYGLYKFLSMEMNIVLQEGMWVTTHIYRFMTAKKIRRICDVTVTYQSVSL